jgi:hypothetical protein
MSSQKLELFCGTPNHNICTTRYTPATRRFAVDALRRGQFRVTGQTRLSAAQRLYAPVESGTINQTVSLFSLETKQTPLIKHSTHTQGYQQILRPTQRPWG